MLSSLPLPLPLHLPSCSSFPFKMKLTFISLNQIVNPTTRAATLLQFAYFSSHFLLPFPEFFRRILSWHFPPTSCWKWCANSRCFWQSLRPLPLLAAIWHKKNPLNCGRFMRIPHSAPPFSLPHKKGQIAAGQTRFNEFMPRCEWTSVSYGLSICRRLVELPLELSLSRSLPANNKVKCHFNWRHGSTLSGAAEQSSVLPVSISVLPRFAIPVSHFIALN